MDAWFVGGVPADAQPRCDLPAKENPFVSWLIDDAWRATSASDFLSRMANALVGADFPIWRLRLLVRTLNPQLLRCPTPGSAASKGSRNTRRRMRAYRALSARTARSPR